MPDKTFYDNHLISFWFKKLLFNLVVWYIKTYIYGAKSDFMIFYFYF